MTEPPPSEPGERSAALDDPPSQDDSLLQALAAAPALAPPSRFGGTARYELVRRLGEGSFGIVYEAIDRAGSARVALKLLRRPTAEWLLRFKREFRALSEIAHPNLVRLLELENVGDDWFFTMELVEGDRFDDFVRRAPSAVGDGLAQLSRALDALHGSGLVHRDVKPSNVLVTAEGRVVVLDFGLAVDVAAADESAIAGTPRYMAPEQIERRHVGPPADAYAVGVMLYEAFAGAAPFEGAAHEVLAAKRDRDAPRLAAEAPSDVADLCAALLRRDPGARAGTREMAALANDPAPAPRASIVEPFVGREGELAVLRDALAARARLRASVVLVRGPSGIGKSALLRRFAEETRRLAPDALVLRARCFSRETVPFKALDGAIDELARALSREPRSAVAEVLPRDVHALARLFPVLEPFASARVRSASPVDPTTERTRGRDALRELLGRSTDKRPVVVIVDDLQWGDTDSAQLLADVVRGPSAPALLFVGAARDGEERTPFLHRLRELLRTPGARAHVDFTEVTLGPLDATHARALAAELRPALADDVLEAIVDEAGGNPLFLGELARSDAAPLDAPTLAVVIAARVDRLSPGARRLLEASAVAASPMPPGLLAEEAPGEGGAHVAELSAARLLRVRAADGATEGATLVESYHDRVRELVTAALDPSRKRALHLHLAQALERRGELEAVVGHLREAGEVARAAKLAVSAAERAEAALAFEHAARLYREALALHARAGTLTPSTEHAIVRAQALALSTAGRCAEAADAFLAAARLRTGNDAIELRRRAAEELLLGGHLARGREVVGAVLRELGLSLPRSNAGAILSWLPLRARLWARGLETAPVRPAAHPRPDLLLKTDTLWALGTGLSGVEPVLALPLAGWHALLALDSGDPHRVLRAVVLEAFGTAVGRGERDGGATRRLLERARELAMKSDRPEAEVLVPIGRGAVDYFQGRFPAALQRFEEARAAAHARGLRGGFEGSFPDSLRSATRFWLGHVEATLADAPAAAREAADRGHVLSWSMFAMHHAWALAFDEANVGDARAIVDEVMARWSGVGLVLQHYWRMIADVHLGLAAGDGRRAHAAAEEAWPRLVRGRVLVGPLYHVEAHWFRGRAALAAAAADPWRRRDLLAQVEREARAIDAQQSSWGRGFSSSLRGGAAALRGDHARALAHLEDADPVLTTAGLEALLAAVRAPRGRLLGGSIGADARAAAEEWRVSQGISSLGALSRIYLVE
ncbi:MAG: protein kinase [Deltaproteobacteria bacterium]|nr:protein kinase [Deltaproteobacteria bacterium]